jgi:NAD(P)-dependent dehydrogenase (short-subunit alcohol dehydrogenase family)
MSLSVNLKSDFIGKYNNITSALSREEVSLFSTENLYTLQLLTHLSSEVDVSNYDSLQKTIEKIIAQFQKIDLVIFNSKSVEF